MNPSDLERVSYACVHFASAAEARAGLERAGSNGAGIYELDGRRVRDAGDLLGAIARAMAFPDYFGMNWDALDECLRDMSWRERPAHVLFVRDARTLFTNAFGPAGELVMVWQSAAGTWATSAVPFHLVFVRED